MTQEDIIKMAQQCGYWSGQTVEMNDVGLEQFAKLIEQRLYYDGIHTCHDECQRPACVRVREAVQAERKACAKLCEQIQDWPEDATPYDCAAAIRSRGQK